MRNALSKVTAWVLTFMMLFTALPVNIIAEGVQPQGIVEERSVDVPAPQQNEKEVSPASAPSEQESIKEQTPVEPQSVIAVLVQAADAISAARPGARRENVENYIRRLQKLEELTGSYPGVDKAYAIQAGREVRIMVKPEEVTEDNMILLAHDLAKKIEAELEYPGQIKVNVIRETKAVEYAK